MIFLITSGKSTLVTALFRLVNLESGKIIIDGLELNKLKLKDLRSNISVIPQDPVLFVGTIRYNLDPFNQYDDVQLWKALESTHVKDAVRLIYRTFAYEISNENTITIWYIVLYTFFFNICRFK